MRATVSEAGNIGRHSILRNRKLGAMVGAVIMAVGVWGMISVGSDTLRTIQEGDYTAEQGKVFEMNSYVFLFTIVGGLIVLLYSVVSFQAESASRRAIAY